MRTIEIYDTTLRDGSQGEGVNFSLEDKLAIAKRLDEAGVNFIEGGYPTLKSQGFTIFQPCLCVEPQECQTLCIWDDPPKRYRATT